MSQDRFIFDTVDYQNGANTVNNFVKLYNAQNNSAATGNSFKFKSDADRMKNLLGSQGQSRNSGYYDGLYVNLYNLTFTDGSTIPSINGPGGSGWGAKLWSGPILNALAINDVYLSPKANKSDYIAAEIGGYFYSPVATTITFQPTSDDGVAIYFNGTNLSFTPASPVAWDYHGPTTYTSATVTVNAGYNPIRILFFEGGGGALLNLSYRIGTGPYQTYFNCNFFYNYNQM
jgi:hypothetical protein